MDEYDEREIFYIKSPDSPNPIEFLDDNEGDCAPIETAQIDVIEFGDDCVNVISKDSLEVADADIETEQQFDVIQFGHAGVIYAAKGSTEIDDHDISRDFMEQDKVSSENELSDPISEDEVEARRLGDTSLSTEQPSKGVTLADELQDPADKTSLLNPRTRVITSDSIVSLCSMADDVTYYTSADEDFASIFTSDYSDFESLLEGEAGCDNTLRETPSGEGSDIDEYLAKVSDYIKECQTDPRDRVDTSSEDLNRSESETPERLDEDVYGEVLKADESFDSDKSNERFEQSEFGQDGIIYVCKGSTDEAERTVPIDFGSSLEYDLEFDYIPSDLRLDPLPDDTEDNETEATELDETFESVNDDIELEEEDLPLNYENKEALIIPTFPLGVGDDLSDFMADESSVDHVSGIVVTEVIVETKLIEVAEPLQDHTADEEDATIESSPESHSSYDCVNLDQSGSDVQSDGYDKGSLPASPDPEISYDQSRIDCVLSPMESYYTSADDDVASILDNYSVTTDYDVMSCNISDSDASDVSNVSEPTRLVLEGQNDVVKSEASTCEHEASGNEYVQEMSNPEATDEFHNMIVINTVGLIIHPDSPGTRKKKFSKTVSSPGRFIIPESESSSAEMQELVPHKRRLKSYSEVELKDLPQSPAVDVFTQEELLEVSPLLSPTKDLLQLNLSLENPEVCKTIPVLDLSQNISIKEHSGPWLTAVKVERIYPTTNDFHQHKMSVTPVKRKPSRRHVKSWARHLIKERDIFQSSVPVIDLPTTPLQSYLRSTSPATLGFMSRGRTLSTTSSKGRNSDSAHELNDLTIALEDKELNKSVEIDYSYSIIQDVSIDDDEKEDILDIADIVSQKEDILKIADLIVAQKRGADVEGIYYKQQHDDHDTDDEMMSFEEHVQKQNFSDVMQQLLDRVRRSDCYEAGSVYNARPLSDEVDSDIDESLYDFESVNEPADGHPDLSFAVDDTDHDASKAELDEFEAARQHEYFDQVRSEISSWNTNPGDEVDSETSLLDQPDGSGLLEQLHSSDGLTDTEPPVNDYLRSQNKRFCDNNPTTSLPSHLTDLLPNKSDDSPFQKAHSLALILKSPDIRKFQSKLKPCSNPTCGACLNKKQRKATQWKNWKVLTQNQASPCEQT